MFDSATAQLLQSAPTVPGLDPKDIPALLTAHFANLVSARLRGGVNDPGESTDEWPPERIADAYELIASLHTDGSIRRASAFVAGTAQQILARRQFAQASRDVVVVNIDRDRVDPTIAAAVLFLIAEQYADASDAASLIRSRQDGQLYEATILSEGVADLARGQLTRILERAERWRRPIAGRDMEERALGALLETLICGIEILAAHFLDVSIPLPSAGRFDNARDAFMRVLNLSAVVNNGESGQLGGSMLNAFAGPHHLAALLIAAVWVSPAFPDTFGKLMSLLEVSDAEKAIHSGVQG